MKIRSLTHVLSLVAIVAIGASGFSQSTLHCLHEDSWFPVTRVKGKVPYCFTGDSLARGSESKLTMLPAESFRSGFVHANVISNSRTGVVKNDEGFRYLSDSGWYQLTVELISDEDMTDCFYVMRFEAFGDVKFYCRPIGSLVAGKKKRIEIFKKVGYEMPQQLHIYSGMDEIRTTFIPGSYRYDFGEYLALAE